MGVEHQQNYLSWTLKKVGHDNWSRKVMGVERSTELFQLNTQESWSLQLINNESCSSKSLNKVVRAKRSRTLVAKTDQEKIVRSNRSRKMFAKFNLENAWRPLANSLEEWLILEKGTHSRFPPGPATQDVGLKQGRHKPWLKLKRNEKQIIVRYIRVSLCEKKGSGQDIYSH